jgi:hypothetical protein
VANPRNLGQSIDDSLDPSSVLTLNRYQPGSIDVLVIAGHGWGCGAQTYPGGIGISDWGASSPQFFHLIASRMSPGGIIVVAGCFSGSNINTAYCQQFANVTDCYVEVVTEQVWNQNAYTYGAWRMFCPQDTEYDGSGGDF